MSSFYSITSFCMCGECVLLLFLYGEVCVGVEEGGMANHRKGGCFITRVSLASRLSRRRDATCVGRLKRNS